MHATPSDHRHELTTVSLHARSRHRLRSDGCCLHGQVLEALALAEAPPEFEDKLLPDIEGMQKMASSEIEAFKVCLTLPCS